jgi:protein-L-isoaspartate O-methyltransferase
MRKGYVCGLERSPEQVSQAHQLRAVPHTLEFRCWDGCTVPCPAQSFDHVISCAAVLASPHPRGARAGDQSDPRNARHAYAGRNN